MHENAEKKSSTYVPLSAWKHTISLSINFLGLIGLLLLVYGLYVMFWGIPHHQLENLANILSNYLTLIGTLMTAISIYLPQNTRPPDPFSKKVAAPVTIIAVFCAIGILAFASVIVSSHFISGFALLAIAGGLFRTMSR